MKRGSCSKAVFKLNNLAASVAELISEFQTIDSGAHISSGLITKSVISSLISPLNLLFNFFSSSLSRTSLSGLF